VVLDDYRFMIRPGIAASQRASIMSDCRYDRRTLLKNALVGLAALPASELIHEAAAQGALPHVDEKESESQFQTSNPPSP
jgi:hypothetical protein